MAGHTHVSGFATIQPTAQKCFCENQIPLRKNDNGICNGIFTKNSNGSTYNCQCKAIITDAGHINTLGN
jgi:hypothetical protein